MVLPINAVFASVEAWLMWVVIPKILQSNLCPDGQVHVHAFASRVQRSCLLCFIFNCIILTVFPFLGVKKFVFDDAWTAPMVPYQGVNVWIGNLPAPSILDIPQEAKYITPSPALEAVEVALGWFFLFTWWPAQWCSVSGQKVKGSFISDRTIGIHMRQCILEGDEIPNESAARLKSQ